MKKLIYLLVMVASASWAGGTKHHTPKPVDPPKPVATAGAQAGAIAGAAAGAQAGASNTTTVGVTNGATGGTATAAGGAGGAGGQGGASQASADGTQTIGDVAPTQTSVIDASTSYERQVGTLIMGTVIPVGCGAGGQAGGSNTHAAGFLGFAWTTDRCYTLQVASAWAAMGQYDMACEMLADVTRRAMKRRSIDINCTEISRVLIEQHRPKSIPNPPSAVIACPDMSTYMSKSDADAREKKILERCVAK